MTEKQFRLLYHFLNRISMWVQPINRDTIVSFIYGFEAGTGNKIFTSALKSYLESRYEIFGSNQGWPNQISIYSEKKGIEWCEAFLEIGKTIIEKLKIENNFNL
ncbi:hypothetical protein [Winogradskyella ouciana]|uniref:Uncharacterized protein n=1 Tax=Winogradskyella ouciana TaxID=2608631 RepID=A0A7K1GGR9_9FLAO|nr:hypothetical protein [Winogradskyella ouciana]MTE27039.1 hypothetical protein [Winogradskyella ouciana]